MEIFEFFKSISIELAGALIIFVLGLLFGKAPKSITKYRLRKFFGSAVFNDDFQIVYGGVNVRSDNRQQMFEKKYHDGKVYKSRGDYRIVSDSGIRAYSYVIHEFAKYRTGVVNLCSDEFAFEHLNKTYIIIGGPLTNELTGIAINEKSNTFFKFANLESTESDDLRIDVSNIIEEKIFFLASSGEDYGVVLKVRNSIHKNNFYFACAGIGNWGTSGAAYYLANNWANLYKEFKSKEFGIVIKVKTGSDTSAFRVYPKK